MNPFTDTFELGLVPDLEVSTTKIAIRAINLANDTDQVPEILSEAEVRLPDRDLSARASAAAEDLLKNPKFRDFTRIEDTGHGRKIVYVSIASELMSNPIYTSTYNHQSS
ncbi:hypothetical protein GF386_03330 [Candidatus Pacearchaeota archaeon]|nr:hypothetical protein [Candidatus Pacearchaeota archaeon]MBD3283172.1 hypothetical protein [Candidatus Pacearchaeota archaeon]